MVPQPKELGCRKSRQGGIRNHSDQGFAASCALSDFIAFSAGALVVPKECGANHLAAGVEEYRPVHLA